MKTGLQTKKGQEGQLVIEYVLLLFLVTVFAGQVVRLLIGQGSSADEQGMIVRKWVSIVYAIANDMIDN